MTEKTSENNGQAQQEEEENKYQRIGAQLRRQRKKRGLEQDDVARQLHLPGMIVNDLESGQVDQLSSIYRRGYIRNYARLLEIDPDTLLTDSDEEVLPRLPEVLPVSKGEWRLERYLKIATYTLVTVAIIPPLAYFFIAGGTRMLEREAATDQPAVVSDTMDGGQQRETVDGTSSNGPESSPNKSSATRHVSASALPLNPIRPASESRRESTPDAAAIEPIPDAATLGKPAPALTALELELLEDSWIEIHDAGGNRLEYDLLRSGQTRNYEGEPPFRLLVGSSNAVKLQINGQPVTWEGQDSGDVAEVAISADGEVRR